MKNILIVIMMIMPLYSVAARWIVESEEGGKVVWLKDSVADIHAPKGLTLWNTQLLEGNVRIEYEARIVGDARVSDLNCFWMAQDPEAKDVFVNLKKRGGKFVNSYSMALYYMGFGGNHNSTTRFRKYDGDKRGIEDPAYRPRILREYLDKNHLLKAYHWYKIRLECIDGRVKYFIDGECLVDFVDTKPLRKGHFGFRTTLAHAQLKNFKVTVLPSINKDIIVNALDKNNSTIPSPTTFGIPFAQGELSSKANLMVQSANGAALPSDQWTLASWPDGSVKWKAVATVARGEELTIKKDSKDVKKNKKQNYIQCPATADAPLFWIEQNGEEQPFTSITTEQEGIVRTCKKYEAKNHIVRQYSYKGSNLQKLVVTTFIDSLTSIKGLSSLSVKFRVPLKDKDYHRKVAFLMDTTDVFTMDVKPLIARRPITLNTDGEPADNISADFIGKIAAWDGFRLSQLSPNAFSIRKRATSVSPWIGTIEGRRSPGMIAIGDRLSAIALQLEDFWQTYPSTLQVDAMRSNEAVVSLNIWSKEAEMMSFEHYDTIAHTLEAAYEDVQKGMSTANGIAVTSTIYLYSDNIAIDSLTQLMPQLAQHPQYVCTPEYLHNKQAFGIWSLDEGTQLDTLLNNIKDFYAQQQEKHQWYGLFNYGDFMHSYDSQRGEWRYDVGGYAWDNTELGTPAMLWYEFLRTGDTTAWRLASAMTRHCSEIDSYHRGPHAGLGTRHNVLHWGCGAKEARVSEAFWNRFMYYLTADERLGDIMHEVVDADQLLYKLDPMRLAQPRSAKYPCTTPARLRIGPDWLGYVSNWFTEWERTGNTAYRDKIMTGMKCISNMPHGIFTGPKALGYDPKTGIISWEGDTAVQNTNHLLSIMGGFEMMNEIMLSLTTPEWNTTWYDFCREYKEKALTISRNKFRIPRLQAYAYWLNGKKEHRQAALQDLMQNNPFKMLGGAESMNTMPMNPKGGFYTNDAATFTLDAVFMQEVMR